MEWGSQYVCIVINCGLDVAVARGTPSTVSGQQACYTYDQQVGAWCPGTHHVPHLNETFRATMHKDPSVPFTYLAHHELEGVATGELSIHFC